MVHREIYVSTDIEADGKIPGISSMLSFGSAAYTGDKVLVSTFSANLEALPDAHPDPETMKWWRKQPEAWAYCRQNPVAPAVCQRKQCRAASKLLPNLRNVHYNGVISITTER